MDAYEADRVLRPDGLRIRRHLRTRLAEAFGVSTRTINAIINRERWQHVSRRRYLRRPRLEKAIKEAKIAKRTKVRDLSRGPIRQDAGVAPGVGGESGDGRTDH